MNCKKRSVEVPGEFLCKGDIHVSGFLWKEPVCNADSEQKTDRSIDYNSPQITLIDVEEMEEQSCFYTDVIS